jgi:hypothetical protein
MRRRRLEVVRGEGTEASRTVQTLWMFHRAASAVVSLVRRTVTIPNPLPWIAERAIEMSFAHKAECCFVRSMPKGQDLALRDRAMGRDIEPWWMRRIA